MDDSPEEIARAVTAIGRIDAVPTLLAVLCETTGMRFAAVARVTDAAWTACAVLDEIELGVEAGDRFAGSEILCFDAPPSQAPMVVEHASLDPRCCADHVCRPHAIESFVSVPIILADGRYFGTLCALDPKPAKVAAPYIVSMFTRFAGLIAAQLESQVRHEQEHLALLHERAAGELREQFMAILCHDLRNPLQAVYGGADQLMRKLTLPAHAEIASRIKTSARRMSSLIDDVLDFARGRIGKGIGLELTEVEDVNSGLATVVQELEDAKPGCHILSNISVDRSVRCDLGRLQQVASNLLANALMHGEPSSPVTITAWADEHDLVLEVWNAGEPIPPESIEKIFEPFWRHSTSGSRNGLGLGLHICSQIVRAHDGRIAVTSSRDRGTQFNVRLPLGTPAGTLRGAVGGTMPVSARGVDAVFPAAAAPLSISPDKSSKVGEALQAG